MGTYIGGAKLYFYYGAMGSAKTSNLLINAFNCREKGMNPLVVTSSLDIRGGKGMVYSRTGMKEEAISIGDDDNLFELVSISNSAKPIDVVLVDEVNLMPVRHVDDMARIVDELEIPVMAYGIRTDFRMRLFPSTLRLMELADTINEIKTLCHCGRKATVNARISNGEILVDGPQILVGGNESYSSMCRKCWREGNLPSQK
jgi:thymidine kinase